MKMPTDLLVNNTELKRYLYSEMTEDQRAEMEERLFLDDDLFFEAANLENELVDLYVAGKLEGEELERFERSLGSQPERKQKVANAAALRVFIDDEREAEAPDDVPVGGQSLWQKIAGVFTLRTPALGYGMAGMLVIFALLSIFLITDNLRKANDIARLQADQAAIGELESQLADLRERENELQGQIDNE